MHLKEQFADGRLDGLESESSLLAYSPNLAPLLAATRDTLLKNSKPCDALNPTHPECIEANDGSLLSLDEEYKSGCLHEEPKTTRRAPRASR